jgi:hypothetical protein
MYMPKNTLLSLLAVAKLATTLVSADGECQASTQVVCKKVATPPTLDGDLSDWAEIETVTSVITTAQGAVVYPHGDMAIKCSYDEENIYMAISVPGPYRFDSTDDHFCAAISTMWKVGEKAEYVNMGACPEAMSGCPLGIPASCKDYIVDVGAHWELKTTEQGALYAKDIDTESGNDPIANKDDEVAVSSYCRVDDSGIGSGNEWSGAWVHNVDTSDPTDYTTVDGTTGTYVFEMSRTLTTTSPDTDAQLAENSTYKFGLAYWDPYQTETVGWTKVGHYVTGCSEDWMDLVIGSAPSTTPSTTSGSASDNDIDPVGIAALIIGLVACFGGAANMIYMKKVMAGLENSDTKDDRNFNDEA